MVVVGERPFLRTSPWIYWLRVVGTTFVADYPLTVEGIPAYGLDVWVEREPENAHDPRAMRVVRQSLGGRIGYLQRVTAEALAPLVDTGATLAVVGHRLRHDPAAPTCPGLWIALANVLWADEPGVELGGLMERPYAGATGAPPAWAKETGYVVGIVAPGSYVVSSKSNPGRWHAVYLDAHGGSTECWCSCPAERFAPDRACAHIQALYVRLGLQ